MTEVRSGPGYWWHGYRAMVRWELAGTRLVLPVTVTAQILLGAGFVLGVGLFFEQVPPRSALFLSTGVAVVTLIMAGLVLVPQQIAQQKLAGTYDFLWSLPVPRTTAALASTTVTAVLSLPGMAVALLVALWRYDIALTVSPMVVPAAGLTIVTASLLGYALAQAVPSPAMTQLATQVLLLVVIGFAPINYPPEQLPAWLAALHEWLPFTHMAAVVRAALTEGMVTGVGRSYLVLTAWALGSAAVAALVVGRRR